MARKIKNTYNQLDLFSNQFSQLENMINNKNLKIKDNKKI